MILTILKMSMIITKNKARDKMSAQKVSIENFSKAMEYVLNSQAEFIISTYGPTMVIKKKHLEN